MMDGVKQDIGDDSVAGEDSDGDGEGYGGGGASVGDDEEIEKAME